MLYRSNGTLSIGSCDNNTKTIYINDNISNFQFKKVLCHEITHAAMFSYDIHLDEREEEVFADLLATYGEEIITIANYLFQKMKKR